MKNNKKIVWLEIPKP